MHIELGIIAATKLTLANIGAIATLSTNVIKFVKKPSLIIKTIFSAVFFTAFMQAFHMPVGASELHFIGASIVYLFFGFVPTLFGFALGLLLQALIFEPADMLHIGVNILSLSIPLIAAHALYGKKFFAKENPSKVSWANIARFDAIYYGGVIAMVAFWLSIGNEPMPLANWAMFAIAYMPIVLIEPVITYGVLRLGQSHWGKKSLRKISVAGKLKFS